MSIKEVQNNKVHTERFNYSANQSMLVTLLQRKSPEDWGYSVEKKISLR